VDDIGRQAAWRLMPELRQPALAPRIWQVGALCRAVADALDARFNPVAVRGEISGLSRPASGHLYFTLKDGQGQIRCAMFRRAASLLDFVPRDGEQVEVQGRLGVYEPRGDLQLVVESMQRAGQGALFEQFLRLKAKLEAEGLFDAGRKRELPPLPRGIGIVTSLGAAALRDAATCLQRRAPHVPVVLAPAAVQGAGAPAELVQALEALYGLARSGRIDLILLVRGGGSIEDLWAFNDERLARAIVASPVPVVSGVGHETDFTIADFCADLRAATPTAAAELAVASRDTWQAALQHLQDRQRDAIGRRLDAAAQRLDQAAQRLGRPSGHVARQALGLERQAHVLRQAVAARLRFAALRGQEGALRHGQAVHARLELAGRTLERQSMRLALLDPRLVLQRGYALLADGEGGVISSVAQARPGQAVQARLADGTIAAVVSAVEAGNP
jgi:exodeoxyribonuclease VII large subunit